MRTILVTAVAGRHDHLRRQFDGLAQCDPAPELHVVVSMGDPGIEEMATESRVPTTVVTCENDHPGLPIAEARNRGAQCALDRGADLIVFLDVDCIPSHGLVERYRRVALDPAHRDALLCGPVTYLPPPPAGGYDLAELPATVNPHPARPAPAHEQVLDCTDYDLFWSLSFAVTAATWRHIGGFCTLYRGYGGEDTDLAQTACAAGVPMRWVGGADAFHQFHPISDPPVEHLADIAANATIFHRRWGWWPMRDWLDTFEQQGLIARDSERGVCVVTAEN